MFDNSTITLVKKLFNNIKKNDEFEIMFNNYKDDNKLSLIDYVKLVKYFKILSKTKKINHTIELDISYSFDNFNKYRATIKSLTVINDILSMLYNKKNFMIFKILITQFSNNKNISFIKKTRDTKNVIDINDFDIRFRKSIEQELNSKEIDILKNLTTSDNSKIYFRLKNRISIELEKHLSADLTKVKFTNDISKINSKNDDYEFELDYSPPKVDKKIFDKIINYCSNFKKVLQNADNTISNTEKSNVIMAYKKLMFKFNSANFKNLFSMQPISSSVVHIIDNIPNKYSVTDKADGEKYQLFIFNDNLYLLSNNLIVRKLPNKVSGLNNSIFEGELIYLTEKKVNMFMIFDCLYYENKDIRIKENLNDRLKYIYEFNKVMKTNSYIPKPFDKKYDINLMKKHYKNEINNFFTTLNKNINSTKPNQYLFQNKFFVFPTGANDSEVYMLADLIYSACTEDSSIDCPYNLDGIIFTAIEQKYTRDKKEQKLPTYKYKPPSHNSLDVYIKFEINKETNSYLDIFDNSVSEYKKQNFRVVNLMVGDNISDKEVPVPFMPEEENDKAFFPLIDGKIRDVENNLVQDNTVVEITYDNNPSIPHQYRWRILRTRWDKTESVNRDNKRYGNFKDVAINTWKSMREAVTIEEIRNLANPDTYIPTKKTLKSRIDVSLIISERKQDVYYQKISTLCRELRDYHNFIKTCLIYNYSLPSKTSKDSKIRRKDVLDIGCGRGGDIFKIKIASVLNYVGVDVDYEGLFSSIDGAYNRYLQNKHMPQFPNCKFFQADGSLRLELGEQIEKFTNMSKEVQEDFKKTFSSTKFDVLMSQFAVHYLFRTKETIDNLVYNIKKYLKNDGYIIFTLFDGDKINELLKDKDVYTNYYTDDDGKKTKSFEIVKKYKKYSDEPGLGIDVFMTWIMEDGKYVEEYLVSKKLMIDTMKKANCYLVEDNYFENFYHINKPYITDVKNYEAHYKNRKYFDKVEKFYHELTGASQGSKIYSFLSKYYIFKKIE